MDHRREAAELHIGIHGRHSFREIAASLGRGVVAGTAAAFQGVLYALHESRRRQSAREIARHRHLIDAIHARTGESAGERN